jgi:tetratricopeptide (TPR) repeat protein
VVESEAEQATVIEPEASEIIPLAREPADAPAGRVADESRALPEKIEVDQSAIAISRSRSVDKNDQLVNTAYSEYNRGNYAVAEAAYLGVLKDMPENRDALLGMAAIAWRKGNIQGAYENYLKVLKLYPKDAVAATGIMSLQGYTDPVKNESLIKIMLRDQPDAAFLYFALGNIYAAQSRWPEAQQAFFEAFRLQPDNPDHAYNLAVSLDQIGQTRPAMEYYSKALELADAAQVSFNTANVLARVNDLARISQ